VLVRCLCRRKKWSGRERDAIMLIAEATVADIAEIQRIRMSVRENILADPSRVTPSDVRAMIENHGRGWVCRIDGAIRGFSFADLRNRNIWALFIEPGFEHRGMGRALHDRAVRWLFEKSAEKMWLTTEPSTRAEKFYEIAGWRRTAMESNGDCRMELDHTTWKSART